MGNRDGESSGLDRRDVLRSLAYGSGALIAGGVGVRAFAETGTPPFVAPRASSFVPISGQVNGLIVQAGQTVEIIGTLESTGNVIVEGTLKMRAGSTLRFLNVDESNFVGGGTEVIDTDTGLWVTGSGRLDIQGTQRTGWTRMGPGDSAPTDWRSGDEILVCPNGPGAWDPQDFRIRTFPQVNPPEEFTLPNGRQMPTECANLTRDVVIEGTPDGRAHIIVLSSSPQRVKHCLIRHMGPRQDSGEDTAEGDLFQGVLGRYPLHFHRVGNGSRGSIVEGVVVRDSGHRAFVPHESHGITFRDCVAHDVTDSAFWWDVRDETDDTLWDRCLAALVRVEPTFRGFRLAGFVLGAGKGNTIRDSVACGVQGNLDAAGFQWPEVDTNQPVAWGFSDNVSHNNRNHGSFVWQNDTERHLVDRFIIYRCAEAGFDHGAYINGYQYRDFQVAECRIGIAWNAESYRTDEIPPLRSDGYSLAFENGVFADCDVGIDVNHHNVAAEPVLFKDIEFRNVRVKLLADDTKAQRTRGDLVNTGIEPGDVDFRGLVPGSVLRFQRGNGTAWQLDDQGNVTDIPAFYPMATFLVADR